MQPAQHYTLEGEAVVDKTIPPGRPGRVRYLGSFWFARCERNITLLPGSIVRVIRYEGIRLLVEPIEPVAVDSFADASFFTSVPSSLYGKPEGDPAKAEPQSRPLSQLLLEWMRR